MAGGAIVLRDQATIKDSNADIRRLHLLRQARALFVMLPPGSHVFAEEPLALQNGKTTRLLGMAAGAIWAAAQDTDHFWHWVNVATWKKEILENGNASKDDVAEWATKHGAGEGWDQDHYDAYCLAESGLRWLDAWIAAGEFSV